jgi:leucyl/phenylalanyl-tRNA--protein transferase
MRPVHRLGAELSFPSPESADPRGLVAFGGDLSVPRLLLAYRSGIFPWSAAPITWWSPNPRAIFDFDQLHVPRSLRRTLRRGLFRATFDRAFNRVIRTCAEVPRGGDGTWISPEIIAAYGQLHGEGWAHSLEIWHGDRLAGGIYGVAIGGFFAGESMFHHETDASKVAVVTLLAHLRARGCQLFDTQMVTNTTASLGAVEIPRRDYLTRLGPALEATCPLVPEEVVIPVG